MHKKVRIDKNGMRRIGVHTSIAGGLPMSLERAKNLGCSTLQIFSHNPRGWAITEKSNVECSTFRRLRREYNISPVFIHSSYLINPASPRVDLRKKSIDMLKAEMDMADSIGAEFVVLHTGSASGDDPVSARKRAISCLAEVAARGRWRSGILLENTAGKKGDIASKIEEIGEILCSVPDGLITGICIDTCHAFSAGYHLGTPCETERVVIKIEKYVGVDKVKVIHLNDSKGDLGSGVDRHEHIGRGRIGMEGLRNFLAHPLICDVPLILETPKKEEDDDRRNLQEVRNLLRL